MTNLNQIVESILNEVFDSSFPYTTIQHGNGIQSKFHIGENKIIVNIAEQSFKNFSVAFTINKKFDKKDLSKLDISNKDLLKLFGTLKEILTFFIKMKKPKIIEFTGEGKSKIKLYNVFAKEIAKKFNGKVSIEKIYGEIIYSIKF